MDTEIQRRGRWAVGSVLRLLRRVSGGRGQDRVGQMVEDPGLTAEERGPGPAPLAPPPILLDDDSGDARRCHEEGVRAQPSNGASAGGARALEGRRSSLGWKGGLPGSSPPAASGVSLGVWRFGRLLGSLWRRRRRLRGSSSWGRGPPGAPRRQETEAAAGAGAGGAPGRAAHGGDGALGGGPAGPAGGRVGTQMSP